MLNSPRSLSAIKEFGINENQLYLTKKSDIINNNPNIKSKSKRLTSAYFYNKENYRLKLLEKSQSQRNILIKKTKMVSNFPPGSPYSNYLVNPPTQGNKNLKNRKNLTDFWSLRYDKDKEDEQIYFLKKQNLSQIKRLIDDTLKLREKGKYKNHQKYVNKEALKNMIKNEYLAKRDNIIKQREKIEKEINEINKKKNEKEFTKECIEQRRQEELKERKILEQQEQLRKKQQEWESKNSEHLTKVENMHEKKHKSAINEYLDILKKGLQRHEKIEERKNEFNLKTKIENQKRYIHLINYKNKTIEENNEMRRKLAQKHQNISEFYLMQKEKKEYIMQTQRKKREEKVLSNICKRILNQNKDLERRKKLLDLFEKHEEKVEQCFIMKEKKHEQFKLNNLLKSDEIAENYLRRKNILSFRNNQKMQKMKNKIAEVNNKILQRQNSARSRIARFDEVNSSKKLMMKHVKELLEENKEYKPEQIYKKVFTNEEINILKE